MDRIVGCDYSFVAIVKAITSFSAELKKKHGVLFLAARMVATSD